MVTSAWSFPWCNTMQLCPQMPDTHVHGLTHHFLEPIPLSLQVPQPRKQVPLSANHNTLTTLFTQAIEPIFLRLL